MPYKSIKELPEYLKKYTQKLQRQWMTVFNSTWNKLAKEGVKNREKRAFMSANSILKKRFRGKESLTNNTREDYMSHLVDRWLGNLHG